MPTAAQCLKCFLLCANLTQAEVIIVLVTLDQRTGDIVVLAGEETDFSIKPDGDLRETYDST